MPGDKTLDHITAAPWHLLRGTCAISSRILSPSVSRDLQVTFCKGWDKKCRGGLHVLSKVSGGMQNAGIGVSTFKLRRAFSKCRAGNYLGYAVGRSLHPFVR